MILVDTLINLYVKRRLPVGFERTETITMALDSARERLAQESTELLQDLLLVQEEDINHHGHDNRAK